MNAHFDALRRMAGANDTERVSLSFINNVLSLLERTDYRRCDQGEDLEALYRLRYKAYRAIGMVPENIERADHDAFDETPNCYKFGIFIDGHLASTIRLHHVTQSERRSPSTAVFGDLLHPLLDEGASFIDPTRFAVDPDHSRLYPQIPYLTLRLAGMACFHFDAPYCLSAIREEHVAFYRRIYCCQPLGEPRTFPGLNSPISLHVAHVDAIRERSFRRYPFFQSTRLEQRLLFAAPVSGESAPLTVLPTAKYLREAA